MSLLNSARQAFDHHAPTYDEQFSSRPIAEKVRAEVWQLAGVAFGNAGRIIDLGCGTGEDAVHFALQGIQVTALDVSEAMLARLESKRRRLGLESKIECIRTEMCAYSHAGRDRVDGLFSNFGALNCVADLAWLSTLAKKALRPGSGLVLTTMGRIYPLETMVHLVKRNPRHALRRLRSPCVAVVGGLPINVYYHSVPSIGRMLGPDFRCVKVNGLCCLSPSPGLEHLRRSRAIRSFDGIDRMLCRWRWTAPFADHFVSVWRYEPIGAMRFS